MKNSASDRASLSRRHFLQSSVSASAALALRPVWSLAATGHTGPAQLSAAFDHGWMFCGKAASPSEPVAITLPHCPAPLSWEDWNANSWEDVWLYRKSFHPLPGSEGARTFLKFEGAMVTSEVSVNGTELPQHKGGYLPFTREITSLLKPENTLEVKLDARFQDVPPEGSEKGIHSVDYYVPGGMIRGATLFSVPQTFLSDVFAKPVDVLSPSRRVDLLCTIDASAAPQGATRLEAVLLDGEQIVARASQGVPSIPSGKTEVHVNMTEIGSIKLWDNDNPHLYSVLVTLHVGGKPVHEYRTRIGFREAKFTNDGFFLNGKKMTFFGLDRHEIYPYRGYAMPERVMRKDAEILRHDLNCNTVRCSHYPQSPAFLDACDELGLMVWEEVPGWQYIGDQAFQDQVVENVHDMILRDRNRPSIIVWGVRVNESHNDPPLYDRTYAMAKKLDDSRPTSGSMTGFVNWQTEWHEDVFAFDDYHSSPSGQAEIRPPLEGIPYMLAETVGQYSYQNPRGFDNKYRRGVEPSMQARQAIYHAQAHEHARAYDRMCGVIAWCAFEYPSPQNSYKGTKNPGVSDLFRIPKLGATFYQSQVSSAVRPVILPNFYWDFGPATPKGPGKNLAIFHNCDRLEVLVDGQHHATLTPDAKNYPHLLHAPSWVDLELDGSSHPELRIDGYVGDRKVLSRSFSSDPSHDQMAVAVDDAEIRGDAIDATRVTFQVVDKYGAPRFLGGGDVSIEVKGPGMLIGDPTFSLTESGGAGAVWIQSAPNASDPIRVTLSHSQMGVKTVTIATRRA
jgi:beta-galactosidase